MLLGKDGRTLLILHLVLYFLSVLTIKISQKESICSSQALPGHTHHPVHAHGFLDPPVYAETLKSWCPQNITFSSFSTQAFIMSIVFQNCYFILRAEQVVPLPFTCVLMNILHIVTSLHLEGYKLDEIKVLVLQGTHRQIRFVGNKVHSAPSGTKYPHQKKKKNGLQFSRLLTFSRVP